jgi:hypothetical protein
LLRRRYRAGLLDRYRAWKQQPAYTREQSVLAQIPKWVAQIRARGGDVIFVRMPTDGEIRRLSLELYGQHTKEFASQFHPYVDCENEPALKGYPSADESHLDGAATREFSAAFAKTLLERDLIGHGTLNAAVR